MTLLGLAERPGEIQGFGLLDPGLARELAAAAVASPSTEVCVTVTSAEGYAIGHGCASRTAAPGQRRALRPAGLPRRAARQVEPDHPATALPGLAGHNYRRAVDVHRAAPDSAAGAGPPDGYGTWTLSLPGGRQFTVRLDPVPTFECDHRHQTHGYQPNDRLRHLIQVRDGSCTFPPC